MEEVLIGFGSNQGESRTICLQAMQMLEDHERVELVRLSRLYYTEPVGFRQQDWFLNGVALIQTSLCPDELLELTQQIEEHFGRTRTVHWGPRTLDLDILAFGRRQIRTPRLIVPHPRLHQRRFVLVPLDELVPRWRHPVLGQTPAQMLSRLEESDQRVAIWSET